jgi:hypothetical protein
MIIRELTKEEAQAELKAAGLRHDICGLPYRGYAVTLSDNGTKRRFIGHAPDGKYWLQEQPSITHTPNNTSTECKRFMSQDEWVEGETWYHLCNAPKQ